MKSTVFRIFVLAVISLSFAMCKNKTVSEIEKLINQWNGRMLIFPDSLKPYIPDTLKYGATANNHDYKILFYADSTGCMGCKLKLNLWLHCIDELKSKADFLFYFFPHDREILLTAMKNSAFNHPVHIDEKDALNRLNHFPDNPAFQCFLLDSDNRVLAIGNPVNNPQIWDLYKDIVNGAKPVKHSLTTVEALQTDLTLTDLHVGKTSEGIFTLKNTGSHALAIQMVESSCGCTVPTWDKQPVAAGKTTEIKVQITPERRGYFNKIVTVHCNTKPPKTVLRVTGVVEQ